MCVCVCVCVCVYAFRETNSPVEIKYSEYIVLLIRDI